jgi:hypothetical protein
MKQTQQTINTGCKIEMKLLFFGTSFFFYTSLYRFLAYVLWPRVPQYKQLSWGVSQHSGGYPD